MSDAQGYNERLFASGRARRWYHDARYRWIVDTLAVWGCRPESVIELGCFDGKLIRYLPRRPARYLGLDADWEGGLDIARKEWGGEKGFEFRRCTSPAEMDLRWETFDVSVCMDTLEHVPPEAVEPYVELLSGATRRFLMVTVPNEMGIVFAVKRVTKFFLGGDSEEYSLRELINATLGRMGRVPRHEHKGFDYGEVVRLLRKHFSSVEVTGIPLRFLPPPLNFGVAILAARGSRPAVLS